MKNESVAGQFIAIRLLLAYTLACDSRDSGTDVRLMQEPLIQELSDVTAKLAGPGALPSDSLAAVEAAAVQALDQVFHLAAAMRSRMPGPADSQDG